MERAASTTPLMAAFVLGTASGLFRFPAAAKTMEFTDGLKLGARLALSPGMVLGIILDLPNDGKGAA